MKLQIACSCAAAEDVSFAASCAAFFSKARNEGKVPVAKAFVSDLSKPNGAAPGKACPAPLALCACYKLQPATPLHCLHGTLRTTLQGAMHPVELSAMWTGMLKYLPLSIKYQ